MRLAKHLGQHVEELTVIGGLAPEFLTAPPVPHQGTTDVDLLLSVGFVYERDDMDFGWLEQALLAAGFTPDEGTGSGWRWVTVLDDILVRLELLCDVPGDQSNAVIPLPGCKDASAMNLQGPGAAIADTYSRRLPVPGHLGGGELEVRFAGLGGFLLAKGAAVSSRGAAKDYYDFAFVLLYNNAGGPDAAAAVLVGGPAAQQLPFYQRQLRAAVNQFVAGDRDGAHAFANEMIATGETSDYEQLVEDAATAAFDFWRRVEASLEP